MIANGTDPDQITSEFTNLEKIRADPAHHSPRHAENCVMLAVVTSQEIAAEIIDLAIAHNRDI